MLHPHSHTHGHGGSNSSSGHSEEDEITISLNDVTLNQSEESGLKKRFWQKRRKKHKNGSEENINVRAAFIHVIGDLLQSVGVVIAGYIIWFKVYLGSYA